MRWTMPTVIGTVAILGTACAHNPPAYTRDLPLLLAKADSSAMGRLLALENRLRVMLFSEDPHRQRVTQVFMDSISVAKTAAENAVLHLGVPIDTVMAKFSAWQMAAQELRPLLGSSDSLRTVHGGVRLRKERLAFGDYCRTVRDSSLCAGSN
jgi:hypothetical protein